MLGSDNIAQLDLKALEDQQINSNNYFIGF